MKNRYHLKSVWTFTVDADSVWDALEELIAGNDPMVWWPAVQTESYSDGSLHVRASSGLGYSLRFRLSDLEADRPETLTVKADGDLEGEGVMRIAAAGPAGSTMAIDWTVETSRRWMRASAWLLRPLFEFAHRLVMAKGEEQFNQWLLTRMISLEGEKP